MIKDVENLVKEIISEKNDRNIHPRDKRDITTTQLRLLLSNAVIVKNKIELKSKENKLSEELQGEVKYLLIKHMYQCGKDSSPKKDSKLKKFDKTFEISSELRKIKTAEEFNKFYRYLEEIVAYVKYYNE